MSNPVTPATRPPSALKDLLDFLLRVDWFGVSIMALVTALLVALGVALTYGERFNRNFVVACTAAGGIAMALDGDKHACVTITPVTAQVTR